MTVRRVGVVAMMLRIALLACCIELAAFDESPGHVEAAAGAEEAECVIEPECAECGPEHMPLLSAGGGRVALAAGARVALSCGAGRLRAYPLRAEVTAVCEAGRFRLQHDGALRHLFELGCQRSVFEDVEHPVEFCAPPLQGRAYRMTGSDSGGTRHYATLCYDEDRGVAAFAHASNAAAGSLPLAPHAEPGALRSLLGGLHGALGAGARAAAGRLLADEARTARRLRELLRHDGVALAEQALASARLLSPLYFDERYSRVADFASNEVLAWRSVAAGNLRHVQRDVARLLRRAPRGSLRVFAGTHGVAAMRTDGARAPLLLLGDRAPVPEYVWTVVVEERQGRTRAVALVVLDDPFVAVSEIRERVFCESSCARVGWLRELLRQRRYEVPLYGLAFCCDVHDFAAHVPEMPTGIVVGVPPGDRGMLTELST